MQKSFISILLSIVLTLSLITLGACDSFDKTDEYGFFAQEKLDACNIGGLPKIQKSIDETSLEYGRFRFSTTKSEFCEYLNLVYEYLSSCGFVYFGTEGRELGSFFGGAPDYVFEYATNLEDFAQGNEYVFVWGNQLDDVENVEYGEYLCIKDGKYLRIGFWEGDGLTYNAYLDLPFALFDDSFYLSMNTLE